MPESTPRPSRPRRHAAALALAVAATALACSSGPPRPAAAPAPVTASEPLEAEAPSSADTPGGGDAPLPLPSARRHGIAEIASVPGVDPAGGDGGAVMAEADARFDRQDWRDAAAAYGRALAGGLGRDAAWRASHRIMLCHLRLSAWDDAVTAARDTVGRFLGTVDEARAWRILGNLYLSLPHQGTEAGGRYLRGRHEQGIYRLSYRMDRRLAVAALEKARDRYAALAREGAPAGIEPAALAQERIDTLFDLVTAVASYGPYDGTWGYLWWGWTEVDEADGTVDEELSPWGGRGGRHVEHDDGGPGEAGWPTGIPVAADGTPLFDASPAAYDPALPPGQKMKALLAEIEELDATPARDGAARARLRRAALAKNRYGPERIQTWWGWLGRGEPGGESLAGKPLHELGDAEAYTLLGRRLAVVTLPPDEDVLGLLESIPRDFPRSGLAAEAAYAAGVYRQSRGQHDRALEIYADVASRHPGTPSASAAAAQARVIRMPEAVLRPMGVTLPGGSVAVKVSHRNLERVRLSARRLDLSRYMADMWKEISSDDERKHFWRDPSNMSYDLLHRQVAGSPAFEAYLTGGPVAWEATVSDDGTHRYRDEDLPVPEAIAGRAGAWVVDVDPRDTGNNVSRNLLLIQDLALVEKRYRDGNLYLLADARDGSPVAGAELKVLTFWNEWKQDPGGQGRTLYHHELVHRATDGDGIALLPTPTPGYRQAIAMAALPDGRLAFSGLRHLSTYTPSSRASGVRSLVFTDRPVYRPGQVVEVKVWMRTLAGGRYQEPVAQKGVPWSVVDPRHQKVAEGSMDVDAMGGGSFSITLGEEPPLGIYTISVGGTSYPGGHLFRVEEYRKPEIEVTVETSGTEARLGERVPGKVLATYLFGGPVADARVTYRVYREDFVHRYAAPGPWDWLYGRGYGLCYYEYPFHPFWGAWGCKRAFPWMPWRPARELVSEGEGRLGADGSLPFSIDTAPALRDHGDRDHRYTVVAEVVDASRRTTTGEGEVLVTREAFQAFVDLDRGYYRPGDEIVVDVAALTAAGTPVSTSGTLTFARVRARAGSGDGATSAATDEPTSLLALSTDGDGRARATLRAASAGQYVVKFEAADARGRSVIGSALVWVGGAGFDGGLYRMNDLEILTDRRTYAPGDVARVLVQSRHAGARVLLATRADRGALLDYRVITLAGKTAVVDVPLGEGDVPNVFLEATTVFDGDVHQELREILVPPRESALDVEVAVDRERVDAGGRCRLTVRTRTPDGRPARAQVALSVFDRAVLQIQPELTPEIRKHFWGDRRTHHLEAGTNLRWQLAPHTSRMDPGRTYHGSAPVDWDGGFGNRFLSLDAADESTVFRQLGYVGGKGSAASTAEGIAGGVPGGVAGGVVGGRLAEDKKEARDELAKANEEPASRSRRKDDRESDADGDAGGEPGAPKVPTVRRTFADTALWVAAVDTTESGEAVIEVPFPENLTTWRIKALGLTRATRAGETTASVVTTKDFLVRLAAPRFLTERDEVVLSANVHNDLPRAKRATVTLRVPPGLLALAGPATSNVTVPAGGRVRVDWTVKAVAEGLARVGVEALTDEESDATELAFPVLVHGFPKTVSATGSLPAGVDAAEQRFDVPADRRPGESRLAVRVSPSLALSMVDALPYLIEYPYGCTEQTLSRFVPAVMTLRTLRSLGLDLADLEKPRANLNAQQAGPHRFDPGDPERPPVYSEKRLAKVIDASLRRLADMQRGDGGWGWWAGDDPSTYLTAYVVWGLLEAREAGVPVDSGMLARGLAALQGAARKDLPAWRESPRVGNEQAFVAYALSRAKPGELRDDGVLRGLLDLCFEERLHLSLQGKALLSLGLRLSGDAARADVVLGNARQHEVRDPENDTVSYPGATEGWWFWWNNDVETHAWMLRAVVARDGSDPAAPGLVKWLLNNRRHGAAWRSTRDTALAVAAFAEYLHATKEAEPDMTVRVLWDGKVVGERHLTKGNLLTAGNAFEIAGDAVTTGPHTLRVERTGRGALYWNAELTFFTTEESARAAGLELKVTRTLHRLVREDATALVPGTRLEPVASRRVRYRRVALADGDAVTSGDLLEVELRITSKNDYDYLVFEDPKPAGCEPVELRSGARWGELSSNMELRDEKVAFFVTWLGKGEHLIRYRVRAEAPGTFHTLPTRAWAMYAPELRGSADEIRLVVADREP